MAFKKSDFIVITVYKTVTASNYVSAIDEVQIKEGPTASSSNEQAKPTVSSKVEDEPTASSTAENKSMTGEKLVNLDDGTTTSSPIRDTEVEVEREEEVEEEVEEKDSNKLMRLAPEVSSEKDGASDNGSSLVSEIPSKSAPRSGSTFASGSVFSSKEKKPSSSSSSYSSAFSFSPITLAPESTKTGGAKATAPVMNKVSAKPAIEKTDKHISSALRVTPSINYILFVLALILY